MPVPLGNMSGARGWRRSDGGRRVNATHSASVVASLWSLALAAPDRFKSPPREREMERWGSEWEGWRTGVLLKSEERHRRKGIGAGDWGKQNNWRQYGATEFHVSVFSYLGGNPQSTASPPPSVKLKETNKGLGGGGGGWGKALPSSL